MGMSRALTKRNCSAVVGCNGEEASQRRTWHWRIWQSVRQSSVSQSVISSFIVYDARVSRTMIMIMRFLETHTPITPNPVYIILSGFVFSWMPNMDEKKKDSKHIYVCWIWMYAEESYVLASSGHWHKQYCEEACPKPFLSNFLFQRPFEWQ